MRTHYAEIPEFVTKDGSIIRELMHPQQHGNRQQSLAEAIVPPGTSTLLHVHRQTEEIYYFTGGRGRMRLGDAQFDVARGDTVCILPGTPHNLTNDGPEPLVLLCASSPAYSHEDTELV